MPLFLITACLVVVVQPCMESIPIKKKQTETHENEFWVFWNSEMNVTNRAEKVDEKMESFV